MGGAIGRALVLNGCDVVWSAEGRSPATRARAEAAGLTEAPDLSAVLSGADFAISVCPPAAAEDLARAVAATGYSGLYLDANAVAPDTARRVGAHFGDARMVDGGVVGPPPRSTRLFLSGAKADRVAGLFAGGPVETIVVGPEPGAASAVKMCYAAWTKGSSALLIAIRAVAEAQGVTAPLLEEWSRSQPEAAGAKARAAAASVPKAWRFAGEMREIAETFAASGIPDGFFRAAEELYEALESCKDDPSADLSDAIKLLARPAR
jgi:3-hydroxyisobutyrate dehydrogenase-like beta-hydroxyacid dehydrogenase